MALTVGVQTVMDAREVVLVVTGQNKALALSHMIEGGVNHMVGWRFTYSLVHRAALSSSMAQKHRWKGLALIRCVVLRSRRALYRLTHGHWSSASESHSSSTIPMPLGLPDCLVEYADTVETVVARTQLWNFESKLSSTSNPSKRSKTRWRPSTGASRPSGWV
jgi:hypothetical protein